MPIEDFDTFNVGFTGDEGTQLYLGVDVRDGEDDLFVQAAFDASGMWERADFMTAPVKSYDGGVETHYASFAELAAAHPGALLWYTHVYAKTLESQPVHIDDLHVTSRDYYDGTLMVDFEASPAALSARVSADAIELGRGVTVSGRLLDGSATELAGEPVSLFQFLPDNHPSSGRRIGVFPTDTAGAYSTRQFPSRTTTYAVFVEEEYSAVEAYTWGTEVEVLPNLRAHVADRRLRRGDRLVVTGSIARRLVGATVKLREEKHRRPLTSTTVRARGHFRLRAPLPVGQHSVWVSTRGGDGLSAASTPARSVTVRR